jgi:c-di-GMP-related signal transduction protein
MGTQAQPAPAKQNVSSVARHPILDTDEQVLGYELSFVPPQGDRTAPNVETEARVIIDTLNVMGLDVLCDGRKAFVSCTHQMLLMEYFALLPPAVVAEIPASIPADEPVITACQRLKQGGFTIALDNFVPGDPRTLLVPHADFIKVDLKKIPLEESAGLVAHYASKQCRMLATHVESRQDFVDARHAGFTYFQGYFFRRTEQVRARGIPTNQGIYLRLLQAVSKSELNFDEIEELIKRDASLCFRLLRYLNSPLLGTASPVLSVRHALNLLGERGLVRWIRMACTLAMGKEKASDLALSSLVRARFCELISPRVKHGESELYLMGLLSLMNAILDVPIGVAIKELALGPDIKAQLLGGKTGDKTPLSSIYNLMVAREAGDWEEVTKLAKELNLSLIFVASSYNEAMRWAHQISTPTPLQPSQGH